VGCGPACALKRVDVIMSFSDPLRLPPHTDLDAQARLEVYDDEIMCRIAALLPADRRGAYADHPRLKELLASG
jgi:1-acyl-sn-glycerol-3-phosphate acyltransferase